ncbi:MAG TPA: zinc ribbon domain-containing protein [Solirubrobacterales bacterium]|nr:zinc ribbon domain-containing protein [Solirubrobacterales bacterium]
MISIPKALQNPRRAAKATSNGGGPAPASSPASATPQAPATTQTRSAPQASPNPALGGDLLVDLERRRDQLIARVAELQWDLGGLAYEMAIRNRMQVEVLVKRAVVLQDADAELSEVERIIRSEETGTAGSCPNCSAPHSSGATFCWQCGKPLLEQVSSDAILRR